MRTPSLNRRRFLATCSRFGLAATAFPAALWALADGKPEVTKEMIAHAAALAGLEFDDAQRDMMVRNLNNRRDAYEAIHDLHLANRVAPAVAFNPVLPGVKFDIGKRPLRLGRAPVVAAPHQIEDVAFYTVRQLGELI